MSRQVTVRDIARHAAVSHGTVSRVLNNHHSVNAELRQRVLQVADELGYLREALSPNLASTAPTSAITSLAFLLFQAERKNPLTSFWAELLHGAQVEAQRHGIQITFQWINTDQLSTEQSLKQILSMRQDGLLIVGNSPPEVVRQLAETRQRLVLIDNVIPELPIDAVISDNFAGAKKIVTLLVEAGHRDIAFIGGPLKQGSFQTNAVYTIEWRAMGYRQALFDAGLPWRRELFEAANLTVEGGYAACQRLLAQAVPFTGLFCANDTQALGALKALRESGKQVPADISVVGFDDDLTVTELMTPPITTIRVNKEAMGAQAIRVLLNRLQFPETPQTTSVIEVKLILRDSHAAREP